MENLSSVYNLFFGKKSVLYHVFSPYRVCPLGAHVDHQHGLVTGFTFDSGIDIIFSDMSSGMIEMCSLSFEGLMALNVREDVGKLQGNWGDYIRGAVWALQHDFRLTKGIRGVVKGSMPIGGVSSSAALLCGIVLSLAKVNNISLNKEQIIYYASVAEREYVGLKNGILDQACVVLSKKDKLLFMDTKDGSYKLLPFGDSSNSNVPFELAIIFSGVTRKLTGTDYNLRVSECNVAAWNVQAYENIPLKTLENSCLRDVPRELFLKHERDMPVRFAKRALHFYSECERVKNGVEAWKHGDVNEFGKLMFESCDSSIYQYECGSPELISIYRILKKTEGVYGGRFSGAGFKGACIALIDPDKEEIVRKTIEQEYLKQYPQYQNTFELFFTRLSDGLKIEKIK